MKVLAHQLVGKSHRLNRIEGEERERGRSGVGDGGWDDEGVIEVWEREGRGGR